MKLSEEEIEKLRKIIHWWDHRKAFDKDASTIKFDRANSKVTSIRLGGKLFRDAVALAESDPDIKHFNRLVELLLWERLEKREEYLVKTTDSD